MKRTIYFLIFVLAACSPAIYSTRQSDSDNRLAAIEDDIRDPNNQANYPCDLPNGGTGVKVCHVPPGGAPEDICAAVPVCTPNTGGTTGGDTGGDDDSSSDDSSSGDHNSDDRCGDRRFHGFSIMTGGYHSGDDNSSDDHSSSDDDSNSDDSHSGGGTTGGTTGGGGETCTPTGIPDDGGQNFIGPCSDVF